MSHKDSKTQPMTGAPLPDVPARRAMIARLRDKVLACLRDEPSHADTDTDPGDVPDPGDVLAAEAGWIDLGPF